MGFFKKIISNIISLFNDEDKPNEEEYSNLAEIMVTLELGEGKTQDELLRKQGYRNEKIIKMRELKEAIHA